MGENVDRGDAADDKPAAAATQSQKAAGEPKDEFFWAGFGASAGGLEALRSVLRALPKDAPVTYIVAQHLAPQHKSILTELLSRETHLPVGEIEDGMRPRPNTVYVTPPNTDVIAQDGLLRLTSPSQEPAAPKPSVDRFLKSLAQEHGDHAIGVILSGTGSDGAYGIKAVRAAGGITIAQDAASARYYGMPSAALSTDNVDLILPASEIGAKFKQIIEAPSPLAFSASQETSSDDLGQIYYLLHTHTKNDFRGYKEATIRRRIERRMQALSVHSIEGYIAILSSSEAEISALFQDLLISVTSFFRDEEEFDSFKQALRRLAEQRGDDGLRIWVPACATGEEAYSIAMLATEALGGLGSVVGTGRLKIFATDLDNNALSTARQGVYPEAALDTVPEELKTKYFDRSGSLCAATRELRTLIVFSPHNILQDPPFLNIDVLSCRNLLIYFQPSLQERVLARFHYSINDGGLLFLGKSESAAGSERLLKRAGSKGNVFVRHYSSDMANAAEVRANALKPLAMPIRRQKKASLPPEVDMFEALVSAVGPNALLANGELNVMRSFGDMSDYTTIAPGAVSTSLSSLIIPKFRHELRSLTSRALKEGEPQFGRAHRDDVDPDTRLQIRVYPLRLQRYEEVVLLIVFYNLIADVQDDKAAETSPADAEAAVVEELERELAEMRESLQQTVEQLETSNEELQAANEELQTSNEEFQSTNEELETSNEELQSTNEELITVNDELNTTAEELRWATHDLENIMEETPAPVVVVNSDRIVTRLSNAAKVFFSVPDALERPHISQVPTRSGLPALSHVVDTVLKSDEASYERYFEDDHVAVRVNARRYTYGRSNATAVVIAIAELTQVMQNRRDLQRLFDLAPVAILEQDHKGAIQRRNTAMEKYVADDALDQVLSYDLSNSNSSENFGDAYDKREENSSAVTNVKGGDGVSRWLRFSRRQVTDRDGQLERAYAIGTDVTELIETQSNLREQTSLLKMSQRLGRIGHWRLNVKDGGIYWSDELFRLTGEENEFFRPTMQNMLQFYREDDRTAIAAAIEAAVAKREPFALTATLKSRSGAQRIVDWSGRPEIAPDGSVTAVIGIVRDMTAIRERERDLRLAMEELARSNAELSRFSYICSHDMREPVRTIASMIELLKDEFEDDAPLAPEERNDLIARIQQNAERLLQIIEGLLAYSRLDGKLEVGLVDIAELVSEIEEAVKPAFDEKKIAIHTKNLPTLRGAQVHLRQLFQNLIVNAVKFTPKQEVRVAIEAVEKPDAWEFLISDDGPGVPEQFREEIFLMFRRLNRRDEGSGSGLGLGICQRIVEQHGGVIQCEEGPLGGAAFRFTIAKSIDQNGAARLRRDEKKQTERESAA